MWERMLELLAAGHAVGISAPAAEPMRENKEEKEKREGMEKDRRKCFSSTNDFVP